MDVVPGARAGAVRAFAASARTTARLLWRRQLAQPRDRVGGVLLFADGTRSIVYRETVRVGAKTRQPAVLLVRFRLRLIGRSRALHAAFRVESLANTPLFAGFPGFRSKLWCTDLDTGVYRGVYQWDGPELAARYAATLCRLLRLVSERGSLDFHVLPGAWRDDFLRGPATSPPPRADEAWWRLRAGQVSA